MISSRICRIPVKSWCRYLGMGVLLTIAFPTGDADAQSASQLQNEVNRLQRELTDLQMFVYKGEYEAKTAAGTVGATQSPVAAQMAIRLQDLERQTRSITGSLEEITYKLARLSTRVDNLVKSIDNRLTGIEGQSAKLRQEVAKQATKPVQQSAAGGNAQSGLGQTPQPVKKIPPGYPVSGAAADQYNFAFGLLRQSNFVQAEQAFQTFLDKNPQHSLVCNAEYWLGETFYVRKDYTNAAKTFGRAYQKAPTGCRAAENLLKLGLSFGEIGQKPSACGSFKELAFKFPKLPENLKQQSIRAQKKYGCQ